MSTRDDWLASGKEAILEPDLPLCDPHHHLWVYPDNVYLVDQFGADAAGLHLTHTVFVECLMFYRDQGTESLRPVGETEHVHELTDTDAAREFGVAAGIVGMADLRLGDAVQEILDAHRAASPRFRGIRFATSWDASDRIHNAHTKPGPQQLADPRVRAGLGRVEQSGLVYDAWLYFHQLGELAETASAFPNLNIVLDHVGGVIGIGPYADRRDEVFQIWKQNLATVAAQPNVLIKLGGLTMTLAGFGWHKRERPPSSAELAEALRPYFLTCIELFGVERCMFESNFPMDRISCSYTTLWNTFKRVCADFSPAERAALLHDNAVRAYRLDG